MPFETNVKCTDTHWELIKSYDPLKVHEKYIDIYILYRAHLNQRHYLEDHLMINL